MVKLENEFLKSLLYFSVHTDVMVGMGYSRDEIKDALTTQKYNEIFATYLLLGRKTEVRHPDISAGSQQGGPAEFQGVLRMTNEH